MIFYRTAGSHPADRPTIPDAATVDRYRIGVTTPAVGRLHPNAEAGGGGQRGGLGTGAVRGAAIPLWCPQTDPMNTDYWSDDESFPISASTVPRRSSRILAVDPDVGPR